MIINIYSDNNSAHDSGLKLGMCFGLYYIT